MPREGLSRISSSSLADQALVKIRKAILEGSIPPDEKLSIEQLASELGISRTPVREAIKSLEADGMLRILPNKGIVVQRFSHEELRERYAVRSMLEGFAGELACAREGAKLAPLLEQNVAAMAGKVMLFGAGGDEFALISELLVLNREFHQAIVRASGCTLVPKLLESLQGPVAYRLFQWRAAERRQAIVDHHREIAQAFRANDQALVRARIEAHIQDVNTFLLANTPDVAEAAR
jgi:DNA-binding GntR family transcriptional regulator